MKTKQTNKVGGGIKRQSFADCMLSLNVFPFLGGNKPSTTVCEDDIVASALSKASTIIDGINDGSGGNCRIFKDYQEVKPETLEETYLALHNRIKSNFDEAIEKFEREHYAKRFEKK